MPIWTDWMTFILGTCAVLAALGGSAWAWHRRHAPLQLGLSVQPYAGGGTSPGNDGYVCPWECLQLDVTNRSDQPLTLVSLRMVTADGHEQPVFGDELGERWACEQSLAPGSSARVVCGGRQEHTLPAIRGIVVRAAGGLTVRLGRRAIHRASAELARVRASGIYRDE